MTIIRDHAALTDAWSVVNHPRSNSNPSIEAVTKYGITADSPLNSYSAGKALDAHARQFHGKRLDYIFYRQPNRPYVSSDQNTLTLACRESKVVLTEHVPGYNFSFSDHFGLEATLEFLMPENEEYDSESRSYGIDARNSYSSSASSTKSQNTPVLSPGSILNTIQALNACYRFSGRRARRELTIFTFCLVVLVALIVGSTQFSHSWINPLVLIFTVFIAWLATTMLYEGFLYGNWEANALMNVIEELEILKEGLEAPRRPRRDEDNSF
jgi:sphingomyelin phosphodiesterase 2